MVHICQAPSKNLWNI